MAKIQNRRGQCGVVSRITDMYLFPALLILTLLPSVCKGLHENFCNVVPKDQHIEVGSDSVIVCKTSCVTGKIYWTLNNKRIDESLSNTINSTHTVLSLRNFTHRRATLQCHSADTDQVLGGTTITTYTKPSKISCILHYKNQDKKGSPELFTCSWEHRIDSSSNTKINYTVLSVSSSDPSQSEICSSHTTTCTTKYGDIASNMSLFLDYANVTVRAKSAFWEVSSDPYSFAPLDIVKITHPVIIAISEHVVVEWIIRGSVSLYLYHCQVKYSKDFNEGASERWLNKTLNGHEKGKMTITEVESCTNYTFAVRCALDKGPWSDWSPKMTVLTKLKESDLKLWRKVDEAEKNGFRKVRALWTVIPSTCQGTFNYTIIQTPYKENMTGVNYTNTSCANSVCDVNQEAHRIQLKVLHNEDLFVNDSVYVPAITESLPQVTDIQTSSHEGVILVSWKAPAQPVSGYMIDYTHNGNQYGWRETQDTNITLFDLLDKKPYDITVTPLFDDKTGRGTQALQICSGFGAPGNITDINIQPKHKSAIVSWNVKPQEACSGGVVNFIVFYSTAKDPERNVTVDNMTLQASLEDLKPETQYSFYVKAIALTGTTKSTERVFNTTRFDPGLITAVSVCGGILIVLVLSLGLCCAIGWKKFKEKHVPDPSLANSVRTWSPPGRGKPFYTPPESPPESECQRVYIEEPRRTSTTPLATGCESTDEYIDPATLPAPVIQDEVPLEPAETPDASSPGECTALLSSDNSPSSPYRSQTSVETLTPRTAKPNKRVPVKQQEKASQPTVYVSLDMFEQVQGR